ncbi:MAG TPA: hypothetical protein VNQ90_17795 [Chthoniobacteraceae bacterium]|nr:hypothetical protein [Chthoniobacteraceae bacterium]
MSGNLTNVLPEESQTATAVLAWWKARGDAEPRRRYLGMSAIGEECERRLWYSFRHAAQEDFPGRLYRLFNRGHREEEIIAEELRGIGCTVLLEDENGKQFGFSGVGGHFKGHMDAAILGVPEAPKTWHLGEFKTHSAKLFADLAKKGVQAAKPVHYAQMQIYMRKSGMTRALYYAVNKDTDEVYVERVRYDAAFAAGLEAKAERIITATKPPARIAERRDDFRCKFCPAKSLCHGTSGEEPAVPISKPSCRQCVHATPELDGDGRWSCAKHGKDLSTEDQERTCRSFLLIPDFVTFAEPVDAHKTESGDDVIEFRNLADGSIWHHGPDREAGHWTVADLLSKPMGELRMPSLLEQSQGWGMTSYAVHGLEHLTAAWKHLTHLNDFPEPLKTEKGDGYEITEFPGGDFVLVAPAEDYAEIRYNNIPF